MADKVSDLIEGGILSGKYERTTNTCPCESCKHRKEIRFVTWINGMAYQLCPLEVAMLERAGSPLPRGQAQKILDLPQSLVDQVMYRADTSADDCVRFLRSHGF